jgi:glycosyltransferase involved in cell wall biosynthesis
MCGQRGIIMTTSASISKTHGSGGGQDGLQLPDDFWVVIAAYNEEKRIGRVLDGLVPAAPNIVVVDDGSADGTASEALQRPVWLLRHAVNLGQGAAIQTGITFALKRGAGYVATFDADGQHDPADLPAMLAALSLQSADFALGSRFLGQAEGIPLLRKLMLRLAVLFTWVFSGVLLTDAHNGLRVFSRRGAARLHITLNRMEHASEIVEQIAASGLKFIEVPVHIVYTSESLAKGQRGSAAVKLALKLLMEKLIQ